LGVAAQSRRRAAIHAIQTKLFAQYHPSHACDSGGVDCDTEMAPPFCYEKQALRPWSVPIGRDRSGFEGCRMSVLEKPVSSYPIKPGGMLFRDLP
jgi:hypothetical protein